MKCNICGAEMEAWKNEKTVEFHFKRYRCPLCAYEDVEQKATAKEKPDDKKKK